MKRQACTVCGEPSIPGLLAGHGKCQHHWTVGAFGQAWADHVRAAKAGAPDAIVAPEKDISP